MKRSTLSLATIVVLAMPVSAQADVEQTVVGILTDNGYPATSINMLSQGQIAELYLTSTADDASDVTTLINGLKLPSDESTGMLASSMDPTVIELRVREVLEDRGYSGDMVNALSAGDTANIYLASSSGDTAGVDDAISSAIDANTAMMTEDPSQAGRRAVQYLMRQGYTAEEVSAATDQTELLAVFFALSSGDSNEIAGAVATAMEA